MSKLALQAEHQKLARLLGCDEKIVARLENLDVAGLRKLRGACTAMLFDADRERLQKIVATSRILPRALKSIVAEKALGPTLASRVTGMLPPAEAADIAQRVSLEFNTEVTLQLDPRSAVEVLQLIPISLVVAVTREILKRREYIAMARFVDALSNEQIKASMEVIDDESMLRIAFYVESPERLEEVIGRMSESHLQKVVAVAAQPGLDLSGPLMMLLEGVSPTLRARMAAAALSHPDEQVGASLVAAAKENDLSEMLLATAAKMPTDAAARLNQLMEAQS